MTTTDPCKKFACKLQQCLKDNVYQPSRCEEVLEEIRQCCIKHSTISVVCDGIDTSKPYEHNTVDYVCINNVLHYIGKHRNRIFIMSNRTKFVLHRLEDAKRKRTIAVYVIAGSAILLSSIYQFARSPEIPKTKRV
ncbi:hypothetical protein E2986_08262 [Frieseomelitta varia]|uniref:Uncharacterized protein n=1 Tax=Frieseomelitta varia TaxID=561572 RepID=A0A833W1T4_9HYME|nr:hypothetical protein E2986_08262 [Frieseomelitta varia]